MENEVTIDELALEEAVQAVREDRQNGYSLHYAVETICALYGLSYALLMQAAVDEGLAD